MSKARQFQEVKNTSQVLIEFAELSCPSLFVYVCNQRAVGSVEGISISNQLFFIQFL